MQHGDQDDQGGSGWRHWGLMVLCCLPMIAIVVLIAFGVFR